MSVLRSLAVCALFVVVISHGYDEHDKLAEVVHGSFAVIDSSDPDERGQRQRAIHKVVEEIKQENGKPSPYSYNNWDLGDNATSFGNVMKQLEPTNYDHKKVNHEPLQLVSTLNKVLFSLGVLTVYALIFVGHQKWLKYRYANRDACEKYASNNRGAYEKFDSDDGMSDKERFADRDAFKTLIN